MTTKQHLPPISAELVIVTLLLEADREKMGWHCCRDHLVGMMRHALGHSVAGAEPHGPVEKSRSSARVLLAEMCRVCPHKDCSMKDW